MLLKTCLHTIQEGLSPVVIKGCSIAFEDNFAQKLDKTEILVSGPIASIALKAHAFDNDGNRIKHPYDIYSIPVSVPKIDALLSSWASRNPFVAESIELLQTAFASEASAGPTSTAEYLIAAPSERGAYSAMVFISVKSVLEKINPGKD